VLGYSLTKYKDAAEALEAAAAIGRALDDRKRTARARNDLGLVYMAQDDLETASALFEETLQLSRRAGESRHTRAPLSNLAEIAWQRGDLDTARAHYEEVLALSQAAGDHEETAENLLELGEMVLRLDGIDRAEALALEALALARTIRYTKVMLGCVEFLGRIAAARGQMSRAVRLMAAADTLANAVRVRLLDWYSPPPHEASLATGRAALGNAAYVTAYAAGQALSLEEAIAEALGDEIVGGDMRATP
jgi:non-specific serine/threonine protein kinase